MIGGQPLQIRVVLDTHGWQPMALRPAAGGRATPSAKYTRPMWAASPATRPGVQGELASSSTRSGDLQQVVVGVHSWPSRLLGAMSWRSWRRPAERTAMSCLRMPGRYGPDGARSIPQLRSRLQAQKPNATIISKFLEKVNSLRGMFYQ